MGTLQMPLDIAIDTTTTTTKPQVDNDEFDCLLSGDNEADNHVAEHDADDAVAVVEDADDAVSVAEDELEPEPTTPEAILATADKDYYERRLDAAGQRFHAEREFCETGLRVLSLEEELEAATTKLEEARKAVAAIEGGEVGSQTAKPDEKPIKKPTSEPLPSEPAKPSNYNERLSSPTSSLNLRGIKRFGKEKIRRLCDEFPTVGHLESTRASASQRHLHFSKLLSRGIGVEIGDEIERRLIAFLGGVAQESPSAPSESELVVVTTATTATFLPDIIDIDTDEIHPIIRRANEIDNGQPGCLEDHGAGDGRAWAGGQDAYKAGWKIEGCPYVSGKIQDDWIRGFLATELLEKSGTV